MADEAVHNLDLGIDVERSVLELYRHASMAAKDQECRTAYEFLLRDKARYYHRLRDRWKELAGALFVDSNGRPGTIVAISALPTLDDWFARTITQVLVAICTRPGHGDQDLAVLHIAVPHSGGRLVPPLE